jgi:hypothetical protein
MASIDCITPRVISSNSWGRAANARILSIGKTFACAAIAPDSEAHGVELRPDDTGSLDERIIVTKDQPYFGPLVGKALGVYPLVECPADVANTSGAAGVMYSHIAKLYLYPTAPPVIASKRADARYWFDLGDAGDLSGSVVSPLIPAFGRAKAFFNFGFLNGVSGDATFKFEGGRVTPSAIANTERVTDRWQIPDNAGVASWPAATAGVKWVTLKEEANVVATEDYAYQYAGNFDFYRVTATLNSGTYAFQHLSIVLED